MVAIAKDFNTDMDDYISRIRSSGASFQSEKKRKKRSLPPQRVPENISEEEVYVEFEEPTGFRSWFQGIFSPRRVPPEAEDDLDVEDAVRLEEMEGELEVADEAIEELEERREGLLQRFLSSMRMARRKRQSPSKDELLDEVVPVIDEDVKEILKILHVWLERLPNHELRNFRTSNDFEKYKMVLDKYGLIKRKE